MVVDEGVFYKTVIKGIFVGRRHCGGELPGVSELLNYKFRDVIDGDKGQRREKSPHQCRNPPSEAAAQGDDEQEQGQEQGKDGRVVRPRAAEVMVDGDQMHLIRQREKVVDLFALEQLLP